MQTLEPKTALGLYSDLSGNFINACLLKTDGLDVLAPPVSLTRNYSADLREALLNLKYPDDYTDTDLMRHLDEQVTAEHLAVARDILSQNSRHIPVVDLIGYSGHSLYHNIADCQHISLGNADKIAAALQIPVISDFIQTDLKAGGVGGPILSTFLEAITKSEKKPLVIIGLNGMTTLTYIGPLGELFAFDVGVGCLLLDKWVQRHIGQEMDFDGQWGEKGVVDERLLSYLLKTDYLQKRPPKSLDRNDFNHLSDHIEGCSAADGAATLTAFIVQSIVSAYAFLPAKPVEVILTGGGTLNPTLVLWLKKALSGEVKTMAEANMPHYNLDAAGYAFLAVRSVMRLPMTFPQTTGVSEAHIGGIYHSFHQEEQT